jgi:hypothetical protein
MLPPDIDAKSQILAILSKILPLFIIISFQRSSDWKVID